MLISFALAALAISTAAASPRFTPITSISDVTAAAGISVRIFDQFGHSLSLDPNYPGASEFSPVIGAPQLPTGSASIEDAMVPGPAGQQHHEDPERPVPRHVHILPNLRITPINGVTHVNIRVPAVGMALTTWATTLNDTTVPITLADPENSSLQAFNVVAICK
ncbi:hypothetical protein C8F04DRAFT_1269584 [Mycena alexandri]|uniref:Uncharacterized protein n=1 Tax=Mycena alexandri TaxID=1745969 RepID=A0AAD6SD80_9AGAR|nr:hypothetical protein C8F04DRAFT_1269584 [Mycena alexandri]